MWLLFFCGQELGFNFNLTSHNKTHSIIKMKKIKKNVKGEASQYLTRSNAIRKM
jgi:hypothetical protein